MQRRYLRTAVVMICAAVAMASELPAFAFDPSPSRTLMIEWTVRRAHDDHITQHREAWAGAIREGRIANVSLRAYALRVLLSQPTVPNQDNLELLGELIAIVSRYNVMEAESLLWQGASAIPLSEPLTPLVDALARRGVALTSDEITLMEHARWLHRPGNSQVSERLWRTTFSINVQ